MGSGLSRGVVPRSRLDCLRDSLNAITALVGGRAGGNDISTAEMDQAAAHAPGRPRLVDEAPAGHGWVHEIKYDGYRMHSRIDGGKATLLTRTGLDWSHRYKRTIEALGSLKVKSAYLDGELCAWVANRRSVARAKRNAARLGARAAHTQSLHSWGRWEALKERQRFARVAGLS